MKMNEMPPAVPEKDEAKSEKKEKNIFLEIGAGHSPMVYFGKRRFSGNDQYVGIDLVTRINALGRPEEIDLAFNKEIAGARRAKENISFVHAKGDNMPFADGTVSEAYISNVFGDHSVARSIIASIVAETGRVLKDGGIFTVRETNTPEDPERVTALLADAGFEVVRIVSVRDKDWESFSSKYHPAQKDLDDGDSYYLIAVKPKNK